MAINATAIVQVQLTGDGLGQGGNPFLSYQSATNTSAPPPATLTTANGSVTLTVPNISGYTVTGIMMLAPPGSVNSKTVKGVSGDTGLPNWTVGFVAFPVIAGQSIVVTSTAIEPLQVAYF
jgi:hypothetical protein